MLRALTIALLLSSSPVVAQNLAFGGIKTDTSAPIEVASDRLAVNQEDGSAVFTGNVVIGQGQMRLSADHVTVEYVQGDKTRISAMHAKGNVVLVSGPDAAQAKTGDYNVETGDVLLTGDVVVTQGQNVLTGDRMTVDLATGAANVDGRVRSVLQPGQE